MHVSTRCQRAEQKYAAGTGVIATAQNNKNKSCIEVVLKIQKRHV